MRAKSPTRPCPAEFVKSFVYAPVYEGKAVIPHIACASNGVFVHLSALCSPPIMEKAKHVLSHFSLHYTPSSCSQDFQQMHELNSSSIELLRCFRHHNIVGNAVQSNRSCAPFMTLLHMTPLNDSFCQCDL